MKKFKLAFLLFVVLMAAIGCSKGKNMDSAKAVVESHFDYINQKDKEKLLTTVKPDLKSIAWEAQLDYLDSIKIISIEEDDSESAKEAYLEYGRGQFNGTKEENLKVYKVKYEVKYKKDLVGPRDSGTYTWNYFVIRESENDPWLIDDFGV